MTQLGVGLDGVQPRRPGQEMCFLNGLGKYVERVPVQRRLCILEAGGSVEKMQM